MKKKSVLLAAVAMMGLTAATMAQVPDYVPTQGLVGWWPFNGNAKDESGNGNDGTVNGATLAEDRFGQGGKAYVFDGVNDFISLPKIDIQGNSPRSIFVWVKFSATAKGGCLVSTGEPSVKASFNIVVGKFLGVMGYQNDFYPNTGETIFDNQWHLVGVTFEGNGVLSTYVDGVLDNQTNMTYITKGQENFIGKSSHINYENYFFGLLDDIGIWDRALTLQEIQDLYNTNTRCRLINTATFTIPEKKKIVLQGQVLRMTESSFNQVDLNEWNYIAWVKTSDNGGKIYKNGKLVFSGNFQNVSYGYYRLDLGAEYYFGWGNFYKGLIDEVRISNIERSQSEILDHYSANKPFVQDTNTVGLWHFDENAGLVTNGVVGPHGTISNGTWVDGRFGSCVDYNGTSTTASMDLTIPTSNMTIEFWIKPNGFPKTPSDFRPVSLNGFNTTTFIISKDTIQTQYTWSTGATTNSVTVNPSTMPYIWVTDGNCTDTIWFQQQSANVYDTTFITVTDTLLINTTISGLGQPERVNTIKIFPNPASTQITIDYGDVANLSGYRLQITNSLGQQVFQTAIVQPSETLDLSGWGGNGLYFVYLIDPQGNILDIRKIVLR